MSTQPRYFVADDGGGTIALWRNRDGEPDRPDPVLYQHSTDPGVWDAAVAALVSGDADTPDYQDAATLREIARRIDDGEQVVRGPAPVRRRNSDELREIADRLAGTPGGGER